jgi:hypothetical protein
VSSLTSSVPKVASRATRTLLAHRCDNARSRSKRIGVANEHWVRDLRSEPPEEMRRRFRDVFQRRTDMLSAMSRAGFDVSLSQCATGRKALKALRSLGMANLQI